MDLISKEDAVALIKVEMDKIRTHSLVDGTARINLRLAKNIIEDMPGIDLADYVPKDFHDKTCEAMAKRHQEEIADRPRGKWIDEADKYDASFGIHDYRCSNCNSYADEYIGGHEWYTAGKPNFCPHCGADMREREGE